MYPVEIYSSIKKNKTVICSKRDRKGEHHVKKKMSQILKYKFCMFSLLCRNQNMYKCPPKQGVYEGKMSSEGWGARENNEGVRKKNTIFLLVAEYRLIGRQQLGGWTDRQADRQIKLKQKWTTQGKEVDQNENKNLTEMWI